MEPIQIEIINNTSWFDIVNFILNILTAVGTVGAVVLSLWLVRRDEMKKLIVISQEGMAIRYRDDEVLKIVGISCVNSGKKSVTVSTIGFKYESNEIIIVKPIEYEYGSKKLPIFLKEQESFSYTTEIKDMKMQIEIKLEKEVSTIALKPFVKDNLNNYYYGEKIELDFLKK